VSVSVETPVVFPYQEALDQFRREGREPPLLKRMSELISLLDLTTTLSSGLPGDQILDAALLIVMGELQVGRGGLFVRGEDGAFHLRVQRGLPAAAEVVLPPDAVAEGQPLRRAEAAGVEISDLCERLGLELLCPILKRGSPIAVLGLGPRAEGRPYGREELAFLRSVAACAAAPIENGLIYEELRKVNHKLSVKVFQLNNLFDISRELTASFDEEAIKSLVATTAMGHLMVSRCSLYLGGTRSLCVAHERGIRASQDARCVPEAEARAVLGALRGPRAAAELPEGTLKERLQRDRLTLVVPLAAGDRTEGFLAVGERTSGTPFSEEDRDFVQTLARQTLAALENVRLQQMRLEKLRQDRELQIAREIQRSLFPRSCPALAGFEVAAESRSCYQVGGDYYDFIPLESERLGLAIADVSGKGTPASILMASVHASVRAVAGTAPLPAILERLNRFLFASTQDNKYVTLFYAELDAASRRLAYVNAGHVPPYRVSRAGAIERLTVGGPVLGLIEEASFEAGEVLLAPGDVVVVVTDGATEALSPGDVEFGDERICRVLAEAASASAAETLCRLVEAVTAWTGPAGCSDDLTALVLKAL
jgi:sigma-B regulation protein RsbU (phosphoserine phosphatase)